MKTTWLGDRAIGKDNEAYIIAEVGSNFDGSIERAKLLIDLAKNCGADAVKFQSFTTEKIISKEGFEGLKAGFQQNWTKPVYEVYKHAELPQEWLEELVRYANSRGIHCFSSPYCTEAVDTLDALDVPAFKIGSGDITWHDLLRHIARKGKPVILGTGASSLADIDEAVRVLRSEGTRDLVLLQSVTNYPSRFVSANVRAMRAMAQAFDTLVGYSDHTPGTVVPLAAVALGACVIEKHFTDDRTRRGPDHPFALEAHEFKQMVESIRILEKALGSSDKRCYEEELETRMLQRRCLRAAQDVRTGSIITRDMIDVLRPVAPNALEPKYETLIIGLQMKKPIRKGQAFTWDML